MKNQPPLVSQHVAWISVDPVRGCPARCAYCYLQPLDLVQKAPDQMQLEPSSIYEYLQHFKFFDKGQFDIPAVQIPVAFGNYTDICLTPKNRDFLLRLLEEHQHRMPDVPVCIPTKAVLRDDFLASIDSLGIKVVFFISLSFLPSEFEKGTAPSERRLENFGNISRFKNLRAVHYWRPITSINVPDQETAQWRLEQLKEAGAQVSVINGLAFGAKLQEIFSTDTANPLHPYFVNTVENKTRECTIFEPEILSAILRAAQDLTYPVYEKTSCAVSLILKQRNYNAIFRATHERKCLSCTCPAAQREICFNFKRQMASPPPLLLERIAQYLQIPLDQVSYSEQDGIFVDHTLSQEQQNFLVQSTSFPVRCRELVPNLEWADNGSNKIDWSKGK